MNRGSWIGQTLGGRYRIDEILGQGGMSAVYKAYDPNLKRVVAIKLIHPHLSTDPRFITRFEEEATAVAQLRHPNIVQVYDFNHDGDLYYMVQEFIPGETLQDRLRRLNKSGRRMPLAEAVRYTVNICEATGYAHKRGMIHRDIKPANIMLDVQDQAILMDFGIVKILGGEKHTATGAVVGTALYLPPEVIRGEAPDARSDLYSLGVTLYEMVSGKPPFEADSAMTLMMMHLNDPLPDLRSLRPEVPAGMIEVIEKSLSKNPGQRYASMNEFAAALKACSLEATPPTYQATLVGEDQPPEAGGSTVKAGAATIAAGGIDPARSPESAPVTPATSADRTLQDNKTGLATDIIAVSAVSASGPEPINADLLPKDTIKTEAVSNSSPVPSPVPSAGQSPSTRPVNDSNSLVEKPPSRKIPWALIGGAAVILLIAVIGIVWIVSGRSANTDLPEVTPTSQAGVALIPESTSTPTPTTPVETLPPTDTPTITPTPEPTLKPSPTITPTPTIPAGVPYVVIRAITVDDRGRYVVEYETFEYTEVLPGQHVHFFFNTVPPDQAGNPGKGPWKLYGGPRPFDGYRQADRPPAATQMCALVANPNHSIQPDSGTCFILPDVNVTAPYEDSACLAGPDPTFPAVTQLVAGQVLLINGLSPDEAWWNVFNPEDFEETCWIERSQSSFQGDMSTMAMAEAPAPPSGEPEKLVTITNITLDEQGNYVVEYQVQGFEEKLPGTHLHFFFDIFSADQVGPTGGGNRLMYAGPSPFTGFNQANRPADATALCALVANPDHTVIESSGNCSQLP